MVMNIKKTSIFLLLFLMCHIFMVVGVGAEVNINENLGMGLGLPVGSGGEEAEVSICPKGANTVGRFLLAWKNDDMKGMYDQIDEESKKDYPFNEAKFDLQFLEYKHYKLSSVRRDGDNFEFILTYGDWKDGDKETRKIIISGESFKIIMPSRGNFFKESIDSYF